MPATEDAWVVLHCYATYEDAVIQKIVKRAPRAEVKRMQSPGFLAWRWDAESWDDVRNAGGITGYVGSPKKPVLHRLADLD